MTEIHIIIFTFFPFIASLTMLVLNQTRKNEHTYFFEICVREGLHDCY